MMSAEPQGYTSCGLLTHLMQRINTSSSWREQSSNTHKNRDNYKHTWWESVELKGQGRSFFIDYFYQRSNRKYDMEMQYKESNLEQEIENLERQRMKDLNLAMHSYTRATKAAAYTGFIVFIVMSISLHTALLTSETNVAAHFLAFVIDLSLAFITYKLVHEFHPLRRRGAQYWNESKKTKYQIDRLKQ